MIVKDEIWGIENSTPYFSPDDKYVMYTAHRNFEQDIFLYNIADKKSYNITNTGVTESNPFWSPDGKYIYFVSDRTHPSYPYGSQNEKMYTGCHLQKIAQPYRSDMFDSLFVKKKDSKTDSSSTQQQKIKKEASRFKSKYRNQARP